NRAHPRTSDSLRRSTILAQVLFSRSFCISDHHHLSPRQRKETPCTRLSANPEGVVKPADVMITTQVARVLLYTRQIT
ncbi:unnamed protein product, partial [Trichogramma brassicae]